MADNMENSFLEGNGIIILILFFLMMFGFGGVGFGGFGGFGGYNGFGSAAAQGAITRAELADGFNTSEIQRNQSDIKAAICGVNQNIFQNRYDNALGQAALSNQIAENRYSAAMQAQALQAQIATSTCDIKTAVHHEGEMTRDLIQRQTIDDLKNQLNQAQNVIANTAQSNNLLNTLSAQIADFRNAAGRWYANPPMVPFYGYGCAGNVGNYGYAGNCGGCGGTCA